MEVLLKTNVSFTSLKIDQIELVRKHGVAGDLPYKIIKRSYVNGEQILESIIREDTITGDLERIALTPLDLTLEPGERLVLTSSDDFFTPSVKDS